MFYPLMHMVAEVQHIHFERYKRNEILEMNLLHCVVFLQHYLTDIFI